MTEELKPCTVCKAIPELVEDSMIPGMIAYYCVCNCNNIYDTRQEAIDAWNTRHEK